MTYIQRRLAGLCQINALEMARLLKALGAPGSAQVYIAGGEPFGRNKALQPLVAEFPNVVTKEKLAQNEELSQYINKSSALAAIDYIGHRANVMHRKYIKPNKQAMHPFFDDTCISDAEFRSIMRKLHNKSQGQPKMRANRSNRDVIAYLIPECMCKHKTGIF
ncbi:hypothetical protein SO802_020131 [Lithocarpus litseifolius]|uniref:O-fucosyltransferase family protein n=1 Tax=Lithocarpus litseifolius TaxID=425828 RepID=A0AAW2CGF0_9ROSI